MWIASICALSLMFAIGESCMTKERWSKVVHPSVVSNENEPFFLVHKTVALFKSITISGFSFWMFVRDDYTHARNLIAFFSAYEVVDTFHMIRRNIMTRDIAFHHAVYLSMCVAYFNAGEIYGYVPTLLLMQDTSSVPLNIFLALRNRPAHGLSTKIAFICFYVLFFVFRGLGGGYILVCTHRMHEWHIIALAYAAYGLQLFWLVHITHKVVRKMQYSK